MNLADYEYDERLHALSQPKAPGNTWVARALLFDRRLSAEAKVLAWTLASHLQAGGELPSLDALAAELPATRAGALLHLDELEAAGWIRRAAAPGTPDPETGPTGPGLPR